MKYEVVRHGRGQWAVHQIDGNLDRGAVAEFTTRRESAAYRRASQEYADAQENMNRTQWEGDGSPESLLAIRQARAAEKVAGDRLDRLPMMRPGRAS